MRFPTCLEPDESHSILKLESEEKLWHLGFQRVLYGIRVVLSPAGLPVYSLNYCAGANEDFALQLLAVVATILERFPEDVQSGVLERQFPGYQVKPINRDPHCWIRLQEMAKEAVVADDSLDG